MQTAYIWFEERCLIDSAKYNRQYNLLYFKMIRILIVVCCLLCLATQTPQDDYEHQLQNIISTLTRSIQTSITLAQQTISLSQPFASSDNLTLQMVTQGCNEIRRQISSSLSHADIPFKLRPWNCTAISSQNYNQINNNFSQLQASGKELQEQIENIGSSPQTVQINRLLSLFKTESRNFKIQLDQLCKPQKNQTTVTTSSIAYYSDLQNSGNNWIYGKVNPDTYTVEVNKKKTASNSQTCPKQTPYLSLMDTCIACPVLYDLSLKKCSTCPADSNLNLTIHQCTTKNGQTVLKNPDPLAQNYIGQAPIITNLTSCWASTPYFNGNDCISCAIPNYFDFTSLVCLACDSEMSFDLTNKRCSSFKPSTNNSNLIGGNYIGTVPASDNTWLTCDQQNPYFDGVNCISCSSPLYFNFTSNTCNECQKNYLFDVKTKSCIVDISKIQYTNNLNGVSNYVGSPQQISNVKEKGIITDCPQDKPYSNGKYCQKCSLPNFFNFTTNQCQLCSQNLQFYINSKTCIAKQSKKGPMKNSNLVNVTNFMFQIPVYNSSLASCESSTPFFNGLVCISCSLPSYFNFKQLSCENCSSEKQFNVQNRMCEYTRQDFVSDLTNPNIYFNGDYQGLINLTNAKLTNEPDRKICSSSSPFYDATSNICITCPPSSPLFNIKYNKCMSCGSDNYFDAVARICINNQAVNPTLERTLMNTF